jgi:hypothetical protein
MSDVESFFTSREAMFLNVISKYGISGAVNTIMR